MNSSFKRWVACFTLLIFIITSFTPSACAQGEENTQMLRIKENLFQILEHSQPDTCEAQIREVMRGLYSLTNAIPYQINLKNLLKAKRGATAEQQQEIEQKKKNSFLSMTWLILHQAGFELEKRGDSILVKGGVTDITLGVEPNINNTPGKETLDICMEYPRGKKPKDIFGYDYTTTLLGVKKSSKRIKRTATIRLEEITPREKDLQRTLHRLVSGDDSEITDFEGLLSRVFSSIPHIWHADREAYYHSLLHIFFTLNNIEIESETCSADGRIDSFVKIGEGETQKVIIFEFKRNDPTGKAAIQVMHTRYYEKFLLHPINPLKDVYFVACRFKEKKRKGTELEPTCWPFKCTNTGESVEIQSLRGSDEDRQEHTYSSEDLHQMEATPSIGTTPAKAAKPKEDSQDTKKELPKIPFPVFDE